MQLSASVVAYRVYRGAFGASCWGGVEGAAFVTGTTGFGQSICFAGDVED